jgi:phosphohistidine phosphatase
VVRHAKAKERDAERFPDDALRPLSAAGRREFTRFARRMPRWLPPPARVLASRWTRAWDTARLLESRAGWPAALACAALETEGGFAAVEALLQAIRAHRAAESVALVGHQPALGELVARLLGAGERSIDFDKGAVAVLEIADGEPMRGSLRLLVAPEVAAKRLKRRV